MDYIIQCRVKKLELVNRGITSLTIRPTGKSRIEGMDDKCLGFDVANLNSAYLFPLKIRRISLWNRLMADALVRSKLHDHEIEMKVRTGRHNKRIVTICGVTLL